MTNALTTVGARTLNDEERTRLSSAISKNLKNKKCKQSGSSLSKNVSP